MFFSVIMKFSAPKPLLNRRKNQPSARSRPRAIKSFFAPFGFSSNAAKAGLKSPQTTKLYDYRHDKISLDEIEHIAF